MRTTRTLSAVAALFAAAALAGITVSPAAASDNDPPKQEDKTEVPMNKRYCVVHKVTGTILAKKECMTRAEWIEATGVDPAKPRK